MIQPRRTELAGGLRRILKGTSIIKELKGLMAYFDDEDVRRVAGPQLDQQFTISVAFDAREPWNLDYSVKRGHIEDLRKTLK